MTRGFILTCFALVATSLSAQTPLRQVIDAEVKKAWNKEGIVAAGKCDDGTFLRRVHLDLVGMIPTYQEAKTFLDDTDPQKRAKLVDRLLADPRFGDRQSQEWDMLFFGRRPPNGESVRNRPAFKKWLAEQFQKNVPFDQFAKNFLNANEESGLFYVQYRNNVEDATVAISKIFMGTQIGCARCHDHPYEPVTQRDFYGMAGFFIRIVPIETEVKGTMRKYKIGEKSTGEVLFTGSVKDQKPGQKGEPVSPKFLFGEPLKEPALPAGFKEVEIKGAKDLPKPIFSRKENFVNWLARPENPFFTRAVVNRVWSQFLGRGFVAPVDDLNEKNLPNLPELFDVCCKEMVAHKYDLKWFIREIVNSDVYQQGTTGTVADANPFLYERSRVRPLSAEEMLDSLRVLTQFDAGAKHGSTPLPSAMDAYMMSFFGEPTSGRGDFQASLSEHLFMNNAGQVSQMIASNRKGTLYDELTKSKDSWDAKVERIYLSVLSRRPRPEERQRFVAFLTSSMAKEAPLRDAIWVLVNCAEFRFNH